jgi:iron complex outermembrane recepter protein
MIAAYAQITNGVDPLGSLIALPLSQRHAKLTSAMQYEIGLKSQLLGGRAQTTLALYSLTKKNLLSVNPADPTVVQQVGKQSAYAIEVAAGMQLTSYLSLNANAALLNARFDDFQESDGDVTVSRDGKQPPDVPEQMANLWAVVTPASMWRFGAGVRYVGKRFADNANTIREPSYTLLDAFVSFPPVRFVNLTLPGRNLTDDTYAISSYGPTQFILGEPRVIEVVANVRF